MIWNHTKENVTGEFQTFSMPEGKYQLIAQGADISGNKMICEATGESVIYSQLVIVDQTRPRLSFFEIGEKKMEMKTGCPLFS